MKPPQKPRITAAERQAVREEYVQGEGALRTLSSRHGIPLSTLQRWSAAERWPALRKEHELVRLGKLCPSQAPRVPLPPVQDLPESADAMDRRRMMAIRVVEDQIRLLLERQKKTENADEICTLSRLAGENAERLLRITGQIPKPTPQKTRRNSPLPLPQPSVAVSPG